jgi:hypothetical protein
MGQMGSAVGGMAMAGGMLDMFGVGGGALAGMGMLDPIGAGLTVGAAGVGSLGLGGAALAGGLAAAPIAAGMGGVYMAGRAGRAGFEQQQALGSQLSGMQFANMQAPTGRGFGPQQQQRIGATMRSFAAADPFTTMQDMQGMMQQFTDMGMAQGIRDAEEFSSKFKKMADTVRSMAMAMGTSMQEASQTFGQMRQAGFYTAQDVMGNTAQMMVLRGAGMSMEQFGQMQQTGAGIARAQGMLGTAGAMGMTQMTQRLMLDPSRATLLMNMTGAPDFAGAAAATSERLMGATGQFFQGKQGTAMLAALGQVKGGEFTGGIDTEQLQKAMSGQIGLQDLSKMGMRKLEQGGRASFVRKEEMMRQSAMSMQEDMLPAIMRLLEKTTGGNKDTMAILAKGYMGMDELLLSQAQELTDKAESDRAEIRRRVTQEAATSAMQAEMSRNRSLRGIAQKVTGGVGDIFERTFGQPAATTATVLDQMSMQVSDKIWGIERTSLTSGGMTETARALAAGDISLGKTGGGRGIRQGPMGLGGKVSMGIESGGMGAASLADLAIPVGLATGGLVSPGDFRKWASGGLAESIKGQAGDATAYAAVMAARGGQEMTAELMGVSTTRDTSLGKVATRLQSDEDLRKILLAAEKARRAGDSSGAARFTEMAKRKVAGEIGSAGGGGPMSADEREVETSLVLSKMGHSSLITEDLASTGIMGGFKDAKAQKAAAIQQASKLGGGVEWSWSGAGAFLATGLFGGAAGMLFGEMGGPIRAKARFLAEGGPGANIIAALGGDEKKVAALRALSEETSGMSEKDRIKIAMSRMKDITGRTDASEADVKAALDYSDSISSKQLKEASVFAAKTEGDRGVTAMKDPMSEAMAAAGFGSLSGQATKVQMALARSEDPQQALTELIRAASTAKDVGELKEGIAGEVGTAGQALASVKRATTSEGRMTALRAAYGEEDIKRIMTKQGISGSLTAEQAEKIAIQRGLEGVYAQGGAGATGVTFRGGADAEVLKMQQALQTEIQGNTTLIKELTDRVVGSKEPTLMDIIAELQK